MASANPLRSLAAAGLDYRRSRLLDPREPPKNLDAWVHRMVGRYRRRRAIFASLEAEAERVLARGEEIAGWETQRLRRELRDLAAKVRRAPARERTGELRVESFAAIREAAHRKTELLAHPVQIVGALALDQGCLAEMATGEGKTLVAALAAVFAGWTGLPCHVITVNDYLARRDAEWFDPLMVFCGLRAAAVTGEMDENARRHAYDAPVTYTTSKELTADFLRDRLRMGNWVEPERRHLRRSIGIRLDGGRPLVLRGLHFGIVDEADSVLIDEAVTPLILSRPLENRGLLEASGQAHRIAATLSKDRDYRVDYRYREIEWLDTGRRRLDELCGNLSGIWKGPTRREELVEQALMARELFHLGEHYVIQDDRVVIVDSFTGRLMAQRSWSDGLQQAVELKEGLKPTPPTETLARLSFQRFFRLFPRLSGMTGTAREAADEFWQIYRLPVISIPTNRPVRRERTPDRFFLDTEKKEEAIAREIVRCCEREQPVLVGLRSIESSERLAARLEAMRLPFRLLNARHHLEEAMIISLAGRPGTITLATNMAGRGTDIRLPKESLRAGGLHVIAAERQESSRVDRQLFGRCARQGDPGSCQAFVSLDDDLLQRFLNRGERFALSRLFERAKEGSGGALLAAAVGRAQTQAEAQAFRRRQQVLRTDLWLEDALGFRGDAP